jgi:hypothetical protein
VTVTALDNLTLDLTEEIRVLASLDATFEALLEEMGPHNTGIGGVSMPMVIEARPGGRWYRDLGGDNGHFWGHVQAIKRPTLLEITGPLFMSMPVVSPSAIPAEGSRRWNADLIPAFSPWLHSRRCAARNDARAGGTARSRSSTGGSATIGCRRSKDDDSY